MKKILSSLFILLANLSTVIAADGYLGAGLGQSEVRQALFGEYGDGFKIFGGARYNQNLAAEIAYQDFGNPSENLFGVETEYEAWAVALWLKGIWPATSKIDLLGKAGLAYWEVDKTTTVFGFPPSTTSASGTDFAWGVGVSFNYWDKLSIQLEYEDINADIDTITLWSISAVYQF